jgi:nucleoside-diphosphate-sugar epimerase
MARVIVADDSDVVAEAIISGLSECPGIDLCQRGPADSPDELTAIVNDRGIDTVIYGPRWRPGKCATPDLGRAEAFLRCCAQAKVGHVVLLASAAAYGCTHYNPGLISEMRPLRISSENPIAAAWIELERIARSCLSDDTTVTILRLAPCQCREARTISAVCSPEVLRSQARGTTHLFRY